jgi:hypothetical protein
MSTIKLSPKKRLHKVTPYDRTEMGYQTRSLFSSDRETISPTHSRVSRRILAYA